MQPERKKLRPEEILYIGNDIRKDIQPTKALGMRTNLYVGDRRSLRHEVEGLSREDYRPDLIIDDLQQIQQCLI